MDTSQSTEEKIFDAAREVFYKQGYDGARMQEIARKAGINQSMLHYYFRTKEKLFDAVFRVAAAETLFKVFAILDEDIPLFEKIERFVHTYIDIISSNPHIPAFVMQELRRNPDRLKSVVGEGARSHLTLLRRQVSDAVEAGEIRPTTAGHLITNMLALSVFPFIARPMLQTGLGLDADGYDVFLAERKVAVTRFILNALKP
ncbi:MAG: TetR/AcrR family transcriptional regulator [Rhodothermales bacterium]